ncbi:MAG: N-glycosylase/DNA lyase [Candidatus Aenigmarchaeota archaeon]|nr:N-glycosylase/DNA lyase [Candidatus Aenigmarchaeota archaeon]MBU5689316.1 N-glycosylase/DNA lyase [Candidatus Aenigmarchaeota archaeon]
MIDELYKLYEEKKHEIKSRIKEFEEMNNASEKKIFAELAFCLCTPQSKARECDKAIKQLEASGLLFSGDQRQILPFLSKVRFPENKSNFIVKAREQFSKNNEIIIKDFLKQFKNSFDAREWLVKNVKGLGYKEASHFLRNIGFARDLAILDRHILRCLVDFNVIEEIPKSLTPRKYLEIEKKMKDFSKKIGIDFAELDLLLFYRQTGDIFK